LRSGQGREVGGDGLQEDLLDRAAFGHGGRPQAQLHEPKQGHRGRQLGGDGIEVGDELLPGGAELFRLLIAEGKVEVAEDRQLKGQLMPLLAKVAVWSTAASCRVCVPTWPRQ
jgi:hypothetical protein